MSHLASRCAAEFGGVWIEYKNKYSDAQYAFELRTRIDKYGREVIAQYNPTGRQVLPEQVDFVTGVRVCFLDEEDDTLIETSDKPDRIPGIVALEDSCQYQYKGVK